MSGEQVGTKGPGVYRAIAAVMADMAVEGISKSRKSGDGGGPKFQFRGIDDVYNALAPVMAKHGLMMLPRILTRELVERQTRNGGAMFYTVVEAEFDLVSSEDGSKHTVRTFGEAMDSSDKSTNKAMSAAFKYAAMQAFCIPTEGDNDADATTHEVAPAEKPKTLAERLEGALGAVAKATTSEQVNRLFANATQLKADLTKADAEGLARLETAFMDKVAELDKTPFDGGA